MTREPITPEQNAAMLAETTRRQAEFDEWAAGVLAGDTALQGVELDAYHGGVSAGWHQLDDDDCRALTDAYTARQRVAWAHGYGVGRVMAEDAATSEGTVEQ